MIKVTGQSSIEISGSKILWFDPFNISGETHNADIIFITHAHYDHFSPEDIEKVKKDESIIIAPEGVCDDADMVVQPYEKLQIGEISVEAVPAYNVIKPFHPKSKKWVGYIVNMDGTSYYICGDTDCTEEAKKVRCDVLLVPCGGTFTMNASEAAELANTIMPKKAVPTHYGSIVGSKKDGQQFKKRLNGSIECEILI